MACSVHPLDPIGVELRGLDLARGIDDEGFRALRAQLLAHGLVLLRDQDISLEEQAALGRRFGAIEGKEMTKASPHPDVIMVSNVEPDGSIRKLSSREMKTRAINLTWHTDSSFRRHPATFSILRAVVTPAVGGDTLFASMRRAWLDLDAARRGELLALRVIHDYGEAFRRIGSGIPEEAGGDLPPVSHPLVRVHPETGEPCLFVSGHAFRVEGREPEEGRALIRKLVAWCTREGVVYRHHWRDRDVVIWDNRCMLHRAQGFDEEHPRVLRHVRVAGDAPVVPAQA